MTDTGSVSRLPKYLQPAWIRQSCQETFDRVCDTPQKKLTAKVVGGVTVGLGVSYLCYKTVRWIVEKSKADTATLPGKSGVPVKLKLTQKTKVTGDTRRLRFALPSPHHIVGVPAGNYLFVSATINDKLETRPYTPVSGEHNERGHMDLIVKVYPPNSPNFPTGGLMSQYLDRLAIGDEIIISGPAGLIQYLGNGVFAIKPDAKSPAVKRTVKRIGMIAGGSGVTAMIPILQKMLIEPLETPKCALLSTNKTEKDIILREELTKLASKYRQRLKVWYTVDKPVAQGWKYGTGMIDDVILKDWMPKPDPNALILICGPKGLIDAVKAELTILKYPADMVFVF